MLKKFLLIPVFAIMCVFGSIMTASAVDYVFSVTTTSMAKNGTFKFKLAVKGNIYVKCGTGGTLTKITSDSSATISGNNSSGYTITSTSVNQIEYQCKYSSTGTKTIQFGSANITEYDSNVGTDAYGITVLAVPTIKFTSGSYMASMSGSLSTLFPQLGTNASQLPNFNAAFASCSKITSIPATLFSGYTASRDSMFAYTFMWGGLTSIPDDLFGFGGNNVSGQPYMFRGTFDDCIGLTSIPTNLFSRVTGSATNMFANTFYNCYKITSIPTTLFSHYTTAADYMFRSTFGNCTGLDGYIPSTLFSGLATQSTPPDATSFMTDIFDGCTNLDESCPSGTAEYTPYNSYWTPKVSCAPAYTVTYSCGGDYGTPPASVVDVLPDTSITLAANSCSRSGYSFGGWSCNQSIGNKAAGETFSMPAADVTCTAQWTAIDYTVSFSAGSAGGTIPSGSTASLTNKHIGDTITLPSNGFSISGYAFNGWSCNQSIGNKAVGETFSMPANDVICTAQWDALYTVSFAAGTAGGTTPSGSTVSLTNKRAGDTITLPSNGFSVSNGYVFVYWLCDQSIGNKVVGETFTMPAANVTCTAQWYAFSVTTRSISSGGTFQFTLSAKGTFYVDCGTGGTLSGTGVSGNTITRSDTTEATYTCTYSGSAGVKTIGFRSENVTQYNSATGISIVPAISFTTNTAKAYLKSVSGDLSVLFPQKGTSASLLPNFAFVFTNCTYLESIPASLFSGYTASRQGMFYATFQNCAGLTSIPDGLFNFAANVSGQDKMFSDTFSGCTGLTSIPSNLFSRVTSSAAYMFSSTFYGCNKITSIPDTLFNFVVRVSGQQYMFYQTFYGCTGLKPTTSNPNPIPSNLFSRVTSSATNMFRSTFYGCTGLTSIPANLFSHYTTAAFYMFEQTFQNCTGLDGYIPPTLFSGLATQSTPPDTTDFMTNIFKNCTNLDETCPSGMAEYTPYNTYWSPKVSCAPGVDLTFDGGSAMTCAVGGTFLPPTPEPRVGQVFKGWKIQTQ